MDYLRQTVNSEKLANIFDLPAGLRGREVEVIILPLQESEDEIIKEDIFKYTSDTSIGSIIGILSEYKNPGLIPLEKEAWAEAMVEKHVND